MNLRVPQIFSAFPEVTALQTKRHLPLAVQLEQFGIKETDIAACKQVHGKEILLADAPGKREGFDAVITNTKGVFAAVSVADCTPVLIYDSTTHAVAAIHAGWRGTVLEIVSATLKKMKTELGTETKNCFAYIGTCISECSFEVGEEVAAQFNTAFVQWNKDKQKHFVDLKKANKAQLLDAGVPVRQIEVSPFCTVLNNDEFFSYRKENGAPGRMMGVIGRT